MMYNQKKFMLTASIVILLTGITVSCAAQECCTELTARLRAALNGKSNETPSDVISEFMRKSCCGKSYEQESLLVRLVLDRWQGAENISVEELNTISCLPDVLSLQHGSKFILDGLISRNMWSEWVILVPDLLDNLPGDQRQPYIQALLAAIFDGKVNKRDRLEAIRAVGNMIAVYPNADTFESLAGLYRRQPKDDNLATDLVVAAWKMGIQLAPEDAGLMLHSLASDWSSWLWQLDGAEAVMGKESAAKFLQLQERNRKEHNLTPTPIKEHIKLNYTTLRLPVAISVRTNDK